MVLGLEGIKVLDVSSYMAVPMSARLLADWGAEVIHIDNPKTNRVRGARGATAAKGTATARGGRVIASNIDYSHNNLNRNKRGMTLDLGQPQGREIFIRMIEKMDVFVSNFRPKEIEKFDIGYNALSKLNPRLVYGNLSGYGKEGPDRNLPALLNTAFLAKSGITHVDHEPGTPPPTWLPAMGDLITGLAMAYGLMTALLIRERTGMGQEVDTSLYQAGVYALSDDVSASLVTGQDRQQLPTEKFDAIMNSYQTRDGKWLHLGGIYWSKWCQVIGRADLEHDPRFETADLRVENNAHLYHELGKVFASKTLEEWRTILNDEEMPWAPVQSLPEVTHDVQSRANGFFASLDHPEHGRIEVVANPVKLSKTPAIVKAPPAFSQHSEEILLEYGYSSKEIVDFRKQGLIN